MDKAATMGSIARRIAAKRRTSAEPAPPYLTAIAEGLYAAGVAQAFSHEDRLLALEEENNRLRREAAEARTERDDLAGSVEEAARVFGRASETRVLSDMLWGILREHGIGASKSESASPREG